MKRGWDASLFLPKMAREGAFTSTLSVYGKEAMAEVCDIISQGICVQQFAFFVSRMLSAIKTPRKSTA